MKWKKYYIVIIIAIIVLVFVCWQFLNITTSIGERNPPRHWVNNECIDIEQYMKINSIECIPDVKNKINTIKIYIESNNSEIAGYAFLLDKVFNSKKVLSNNGEYYINTSYISSNYSLDITPGLINGVFCDVVYTEDVECPVV